MALQARTADMDVLVSLAILSGYLYSLGATFLFAASDFYWEISTLVLFLLFGHWMEMRSVRGASGALQELVKLIPPNREPGPARRSDRGGRDRAPGRRGCGPRPTGREGPDRRRCPRG